MEQQDISIEQVLEIAKSRLPKVDDNTLIQQFEIMKSETGLNNYETLLYLMKMISENKQGKTESPINDRFSGLMERLRR